MTPGCAGLPGPVGKVGPSLPLPRRELGLLFGASLGVSAKDHGPSRVGLRPGGVRLNVYGRLAHRLGPGSRLPPLRAARQRGQQVGSVTRVRCGKRFPDGLENLHIRRRAGWDARGRDRDERRDRPYGDEPASRSFDPCDPRAGWRAGGGRRPDLARARTGRPQRAEASALAEEHGLERFTTSLDEALADPSCEIYFDAAATWPPPPRMERAITAGKHVYREKPSAPTLDSALRIARLARDAGIKHGVVEQAVPPQPQAGR